MTFMNLAPRHYPETRLRRIRKQPFSRSLIRETLLSVEHLVQPLFVVEGTQQQQEIATMPWVKRLSLDLLLEEVQTLASLKISAVMLFPLIDASHKDLQATYAYDDEGLIQRAVRAIRKHFRPWEL